MSDQWHYQLRLYLADELAEVARRDPGDPAFGPLSGVLEKHNATMKCQFDAFASYVAEAEKHGIEGYPLYEWTKATIEDPVKKRNTSSRLLFMSKGEKPTQRRKQTPLRRIYSLVDGKLITRLSRHDTNPANNPQPPERFRKPQV